ncbi:MAG: SAM hydrolase/SAM-dependent halogenase family protein [Acidimicrobiales bacterium]
MPARRDTISFLSDYGTDDELVGVVKSVIRSIAAHVTVIDLTHGIPPHDVRAGGLALARASQYLAPGVALAVVDPGVGTDRRAVAVEVAEGQAIFVGPDNGLLASAVTMVGGATRAVELTATHYHLPAPGPTFAGRDVFAPAAAHLCNGVELAELGRPIDPAGLIPGVMPVPRLEEGRLVAEVLWVDRFGNLQLNVDPDELAEPAGRIVLRLGDRVRTAVRAESYAAVATGELGLVVDGYGLLSICLCRHSAAAELGLDVGDTVILGGDDQGGSPVGGPEPVHLRPRRGRAGT